MAYGPDNPGLVHCGDAMDVRGSGVNTQILIPSRNGKTGAMDFGNGRLYALDSNNGIAAYEVRDAPLVEPPTLSEVRWSTGVFQCTIQGQAGQVYVMETSSNRIFYDTFESSLDSGLAGFPFIWFSFP